MATFAELGVSFEYPDDWEVDAQPGDRESAVTVQTPGSAFLLLTLIADRPSADHVLNSAQKALEEEYADCEVEVGDSAIPGVDAEVRGIDFTCHDLVTHATLQAYDAGRQTVFVMTQRADIEADEVDAGFRQIESSLRVR